MNHTVAGSCSGCGAGTTAPGLCERCIWRVTMAKRSRDESMNRMVADLEKRIKGLEQEVWELHKEIAEKDAMLDDWRYHPYIPEDSP